MAELQTQKDDIEKLINRFKHRYSKKNNINTAKDYASAIRQFFNYLLENGSSPWMATSRELEDHLMEMLPEDPENPNDGHAPSSIKSTCAAVSAFYKEADRLAPPEVEVPENPAANVELSDWSAMKVGTKKARALRNDVYYLTPTEVEELREYVPKPSIRNELIIQLLFQTGIRCSELTDIRLGDIDRNARTVRIRSKKTYLNRKVGYRKSLDFLLSRWLDGGLRDAEAAAPQSEYLFPTKKSEQVTPRHVNRIVRNAAENADLQEMMYTDIGGNERAKITAHTLRHSFAMASINPDVGGGKMDIRNLQAALGHAKLETTEKYLRVTEEDTLEAMRRFGPD